MKKINLLSFIFFAFFYCSAQDNKNRFIDSITNRIDSIKSIKTFALKRKITGNKIIREKWVYKNGKDKSFFSVTYKNDSTDFSETYYTYKGKLIFSSEREVSFYPSSGPESYSVWGGDYYFSGNKMIYHVTLGHGKSESEDNDWDPEKETLLKFRQRSSQLKAKSGN